MLKIVFGLVRVVTTPTTATIPQTRVGEGRGPLGRLPGGHVSIPWGIQKIMKK